MSDRRRGHGYYPNDNARQPGVNGDFINESGSRGDLDIPEDQEFVPEAYDADSAAYGDGSYTDQAYDTAYDETYDDAPDAADDAPFDEAYDEDVPDAARQGSPAILYDEQLHVEEDPFDDPNTWGEVPIDSGELPDDADRYARSIFKPSVRKPNFAVSVAVNVVRILALLVLLAGLAGLGAIAGIAKGYVETAPTLNLAALDEQAQTSFIYDANGSLITEYKGVENRVMVSIAAMPKYLQNAFVAVEDSRFYTHSGVDLKRIVGAFVANLTSSSTQGGSTITQQLIKNTLLSSEQSYKRKIQEAYLALQLEQTYTKDEILECYLNTIWLGENYYGVQVAAQGYFGKGLGELTLRECAMLAGVCNSPYYYNPRRNFYTREKEGVDYPKITNDRTDYVLRCMYENQFITYEQYQEALNPLTANVLQQSPISTGMYDYPHYVEYGIREAVGILLEINNLEDTSANRAAMENKLRTGGYRIQLAIDVEIQQLLEDTIANWTKYPSLRDPADKVMRTSNGDGTYTETIEPQAAAVVLDYRTGEIKAMVGSRTTPTAQKTLNRATDMKMPVGSAIKPISVYAPAIEMGGSPASIVYNMPLPISGWKDANGSDTWPRNYGGSNYVGPETLREAMRNSHNTAAAQTLMTMVGVSNSVQYLNLLGVDNDHIDATPFGLSLGSSGITPLQMTVAYGVLANGGVYQEPISVLGISDSEGRVVWDGHANQERRRVFSSATSYMVVDMLKDVVSSGTGTSAKIKGQTVAGKTGTNSDQKGVFFAGATGYYASALWVGHDNYKALASSSTGSGAAAPLWQSYMSKIHTAKGLSNKDILDGSPSDYGLVKVTTCAVSGQLATEACYQDTTYGVVTDYWAQSSQPTMYCQLHAAQNICLDSGELAGPYCTNVGLRGVITIPQGHPLSQFIGTEYEDVIAQYLGSSATAVTSTCSWHTQSQPQGGAAVNIQFIQSAERLMDQASAVLFNFDPGSQEFQSLSYAIGNMRNVLDSASSTQTDVVAAMTQLATTMAQVGIY